jgi:hypothetical protein
VQPEVKLLHTMMGHSPSSLVSKFEIKSLSFLDFHNRKPIASGVKYVMMVKSTLADKPALIKEFFVTMNNLHAKTYVEYSLSTDDFPA